MNSVLNIGALVDALAPLADIVAEKVAMRMREAEAERQPKYYTPKDVCDILHISAPTLWRYEKAGIIRPCIVGGSKRYLESEITEAVAAGKLRKNARKGAR